MNKYIIDYKDEVYLIHADDVIDAIKKFNKNWFDLDLTDVNFTIKTVAGVEYRSS